MAKRVTALKGRNVLKQGAIMSLSNSSSKASFGFSKASRFGDRM